MVEYKEQTIENEEDTVDLLEIWNTVVDHKLLIAKCTVITTLLAGAYLLVATPTYESVALLRVKQSQSLGDSILSSLPTGTTTATQQLMNTDSQILKSREVVIPVIEKTQKPDKDGVYPDYDAFVKSHITTTPVKDADIMQVAVTASTAEEAQQMNQLLLKGFLNRLTDLSQSEKKTIRQFIEKRVVSARRELTDAENKLQAYQSEHKIYSPTDQMKGLTDKISMIDKAKAENQLDLEQAQSTLASTNNQLNSAGVSIATSPTIDKYKTQLADLEAQKASYADKYTDEHPTMQALDQQIKTVQASLNTEIGNIVAQQAPSSSPVQQGLLADKYKSEAMVAVAQSKAAALAKLDADTNKIIEQFPEQEKGYIQLQRDQDVAQEIYIMLAKRLEEAKVAEVMVPTEVQVVDNPTLPDKPIAPRKGLTLIIGFLLGLLGSTAYVIANSLLNRKIKTADDVEKYLGLPVLGVVPLVKDKEEHQHKRSFWHKVKRGVLWRK